MTNVKTYTYKYVGTEHTIVKVKKNEPKIRIEAGEMFESDQVIKSQFIKEIGMMSKDTQVHIPPVSEENIVSTSVQVSNNITRAEAIKMYIEKVGKRPGPQWTIEEILSKIS